MKWRIPLIVFLLIGSFCWNNLNAQTKRLPSQIPLEEQPFYKKRMAGKQPQPQASLRSRRRADQPIPSTVPLSRQVARANQNRPAGKQVAPKPMASASRGSRQQQIAKLPSHTVKSDKRSMDEFRKKRNLARRPA